jgi:hypothetical protein
MTVPQQTRDSRRFRLAGNDNEIIVDDTPADAEDDVEGHRLATNDNETTVEGLKRVAPDAGEDDLGPLGARAR